MAELAPTTDVVAKGLGRLLEQYKGKENIETWIQIYLEGVQDLEDHAWLVYTQRFLENAEGVQLDVLGDIVGEQRGGKEDPQYRIWIGVRIRLNRSFGTIKDVIDCILLATDALFTVREYTSAAFEVRFDEHPDFPNDIQAIVKLGKAAGVNGNVFYPPDDEPGFRFKNVGDSDDPDKGFGDVG